MWPVYKYGVEPTKITHSEDCLDRYREPSEIDPKEYAGRPWLKDSDEAWYGSNKLRWTFPFGREAGLRHLLRQLAPIIEAGEGKITTVLADTAKTQPLIMHAAPPKKWADSEGFGDMASLSELFHIVDESIAQEFNLSLIPCNQYS